MSSPGLDLTSLRPAAGPDPLKLGFLALLALYLGGTVLDPTRGTVVNGILFYTHEAGHLLFRPFGEFLTIAGGTITQVLVPLAFTAHFARQRQAFSAAITLLWLALALLGASVYAGDAIAMELPLSTTWTSGTEEMAEHGETGHDFNNLLMMTGMLHERGVALVAGAFRWSGTLVFGLALYLGLLTAGAPVPARLALPGPGRPRARKPPARRAAPAPKRQGPQTETKNRRP